MVALLGIAPLVGLITDLTTLVITVVIATVLTVITALVVGYGNESAFINRSNFGYWLHYR